MAYGEWLPKYAPASNSCEEGDVIARENNDEILGYRKANNTDKIIIGVMNTASVSLSGNLPADTSYYDTAGNEIEFENLTERLLYGHIPTAFNGTVDVKFVGDSEIGGYVVMSDIQGVAKLKENDDDSIVFGKILQDTKNDTTDLTQPRLIKIMLLDNVIMNEVVDLKTNTVEISEALNVLLMGDTSDETTD